MERLTDTHLKGWTTGVKACVSQTDWPLSDDNWVVKVTVILGWSNHGMVEFRIIRGGRKAKSRITTHSFRRADFGLFRDLLGKKSHEIHCWREEGSRTAG